MTENEKIECAIHCAKFHAEIEVCEDCKGYNMDSSACKEIAMEALKALEEIQEYRKIGTVEECREAVEKTEKKKPKLNYKSFFGKKVYTCPTCANCCLEEFANERQNNNYCWDCGQRLDWSE